MNISNYQIDIITVLHMFTKFENHSLFICLLIWTKIIIKVLFTWHHNNLKSVLFYIWVEGSCKFYCHSGNCQNAYASWFTANMSTVKIFNTWLNIFTFNKYELRLFYFHVKKMPKSVGNIIFKFPQQFSFSYRVVWAPTLQLKLWHHILASEHS